MTPHAIRLDVTLRPFLNSDLPFLEALYGETSESMLSEQALGNRSLGAAFPGLLQGVPGLCIILTDKREPVGIVSAERRTTPEGSVLWIRLILIAKAHRRCGYGEAAIFQLLHKAEHGGPFRRALLAVDGQNNVAMAFWQAMGFRMLRRQHQERNPASSILILARERKAP